MASILLPALVLGGLGAVLSLVLLVAARKFAVYEDPLVAAVEDALPNANCGACGYPGCRQFAVAFVENPSASMFCPPGGADVSKRVAALLGVEASTKEVPLALVMCDGTCERAGQLSRYEGIEDCRAAALIDGGTKVCPYGCLGLGSCERACDYGAIRMVDGIAEIDEHLCVGCGACVKACPRGIIRMGPRGTRVLVACSSHDNGKAVRGYCEVGCIGCKRCVKACEYDAMQFDDSLARVDHEKCTACGACIAACPRDIIFGFGLSDEAKAIAYPPKSDVVEKREGDEKPARAKRAAREE